MLNVAKLPLIVRAQDYHDFKEYLQIANMFVTGPTKQALDFEELGFMDGSYLAVFFQKDGAVDWLEVAKVFSLEFSGAFKDKQTALNWFDDNDLNSKVFVNMDQALDHVAKTHKQFFSKK